MLVRVMPNYTRRQSYLYTIFDTPCMLDHVAQHDDQLPLVSVPDATTATQLGDEARSTQSN